MMIHWTSITRGIDMIDPKFIRYALRFLGMLDSIDQLPKEGSDGDMYIVKEQTKVNVDGDMTNVTVNTTYVRSSDVWLVFQKETIYEE